MSATQKVSPMACFSLQLGRFHQFLPLRFHRDFSVGDKSIPGTLDCFKLIPSKQTFLDTSCNRRSLRRRHVRFRQPQVYELTLGSVAFLPS